MEILKFKNNFVVVILTILTIVCNINNRILIISGQYIPTPRYAASSEIIGDRLYVIGGQVSTSGIADSSTTSKEVIYLDLSNDFNSSSSPWVDYSQLSPLPVLNSWADSCEDKDNKMIYLFEGVIEDTNTNNNILDKQIYVFETVGNNWATPNVTGVAPNRRRNMKVVIDD